MQILLSCAKDMRRDFRGPATLSAPAFSADADAIAACIRQYSPADLQQMLGISAQLAHEVWSRYFSFFDGDNAALPAILAYCGVAFRQLDAGSFSAGDMDFAQHHLIITSFLYGLLRPLDAIHLYRLEGSVKLPCTGGETIFRYWQPKLTPFVADAVRADDGILVNLASAEMKHLFNWRNIERNLTVVTPSFMVSKGGRLSSPSIYAKKCRGAMTSWIITNRITDPADLRGFSYGGFTYCGEAAGDNSYTSPVFILDL